MQLALQAQIAEARKRIAGLEGKLRALDELVVSIANERQQYQILADICDALEKLGTMGAAELFWAGHSNGAAPEQRLRQLRLTVTEFQQKTAAIEQSRHSLQDGIQEQSDNIRLLPGSTISVTSSSPNQRYTPTDN